MYDLGIIGAGPAGYVAAERAGMKGLKVILFDEKKLGGVCLNEGCIPTKTILYSAKILQNARDGEKYGISCTGLSFDYGRIMDRKNKVVARLVGGIAAALKKHKVEVVYAHAEMTEREHDHIIVKAGNDNYKCRNILLATGSEALIPPVKGLVREEILTNREILELNSVPESLIIIGGGVVGMEFASFFNTMGSRVTVIEMLGEILSSNDLGLSSMLRTELSKKGVVFNLNSRVVEIKGKDVIFENESILHSVTSEKILISVGRKPIITGLGLEKMGVETFSGGVKIDTHCRTNIPNIYAAGDITGFSLLAHTASREAEVAVNNICGKHDLMRYSAIPSVVYTNPEVASVGITEEEAKTKNIKYKIRSLPMSYAGRFVAENEGKNGLVKILVGEEFNEVLGVHMIGNPSSEIIYGAAIMIEMQMRLQDLEEVVFPHPTVSEIFRETVFSFQE